MVELALDLRHFRLGLLNNVIHFLDFIGELFDLVFVRLFHGRLVGLTSRLLSGSFPRSFIHYYLLLYLGFFFNNDLCFDLLDVNVFRLFERLSTLSLDVLPVVLRPLDDGGRGRILFSWLTY